MSKLMSVLMCYEKMPYGETLIRTLIKTLILTLMFFLNTKSTKETKISFVLCIPCSNEN